MTEQFPPPGPQPTGPSPEQPTSQAELNRRAREAKATAKANKNWFARHKVLTGVGAVAVLGVVGGAMGSGGDEPAAAEGQAPAVEQADATEASGADDQVSTETTSDEAATAETTVGIGDTVRDGKFEFTVTDVEDGVSSVGDQYFGEEAQGQFVLVHMKVENIGDEAQYFMGDNQYLHDSEGKQYSADTEAAIYLDEAESLLSEINPGNTVEGVVVFDVPTKADLDSIELHDSAFSGGATVDLD
ncbi:DUF4352 domain-containing protein [Isoptericola sp. NPDC019482]|uniref:DUF4352 domain-containing protein n=1 Tax=Isoptericola sp. NPDC019482 TaxID=3154688 RepID=UPI0034796650